MSIIELLHYLEDSTIQWLVSFGLTAHTATVGAVLIEVSVLFLTPIGIVSAYLGDDILLYKAIKRRCATFSGF